MSAHHSAYDTNLRFHHIRYIFNVILTVPLSYFQKHINYPETHLCVKFSGILTC